MTNYILDNDPDIVNTPDGTIVKTAAKFLSLIRRSGLIWHQYAPPAASWVFRGQKDSRWVLKPAIWRSDNRYVEFIPKLVTEFKEWLNEQNYPAKLTEEDLRVSVWVYVELMLVKRFRSIAWINAFPIAAPLSVDEKYHVFKGKYPKHIFPLSTLLRKEKVHLAGEFDPSMEPDIAMAQHYDVPTRMLDWTESPLTACYFACKDHVHDERKPVNITIAGLCQSHIMGLYWKPYGKKDKTIRKVINDVFPDRYRNPFIRAQEGLLTSVDHLWAVKFFLENNEWPSVEDAIRLSLENLEQKNFPFDYKNEFLKKIILPSSEVENLKILLLSEGVSKEKLMPTLNHVAELSNQQVFDHLSDSV